MKLEISTIPDRCRFSGYHRVADLVREFMDSPDVTAKFVYDPKEYSCTTSAATTLRQAVRRGKYNAKVIMRNGGVYITKLGYTLVFSESKTAFVHGGGTLPPIEGKDVIRGDET